jgi:hypothetical protein
VYLFYSRLACSGEWLLNDCGQTRLLGNQEFMQFV